MVVSQHALQVSGGVSPGPHPGRGVGVSQYALRQTTHPPGWLLLLRTIRILLECILVNKVVTAHENFTEKFELLKDLRYDQYKEKNFKKYLSLYLSIGSTDWSLGINTVNQLTYKETEKIFWLFIDNLIYTMVKDLLENVMN